MLILSGFCVHSQIKISKLEKDLCLVAQASLNTTKNAAEINKRQQFILKTLQNHELRLETTENSIIGITVFLSTK